MTPREKYFIYKAWEDKTVRDSYNTYNAVFTAVCNVNRPKRKKALKLWRKNSVKKADMDIIQENLSIIREVDENEGNVWIKMIYDGNGLKYPERTVENG